MMMDTTIMTNNQYTTTTNDNDELEYEVEDEEKRPLRIDVDTHSDLSVPILATTTTTNTNNKQKAPSWVTPTQNEYSFPPIDDIHRRTNPKEESTFPSWHQTTTITTTGSQVGSDVYSDTSNSRKRIITTHRRRPRPWDSPREDTPLLKQQSLDRHVIGPDNHQEEEEDEDPITPLWSGRLLTQSSKKKKHWKTSSQQSSYSHLNYWYIVGMTMHMMGMIIYDLVLKQNRWTLLQNWVGGPSAETLTKWGVLHPGYVLVTNQWWRFFTSITCTTSIPQYILSIYTCYHLPSSFSISILLGSTTLAAIWTCLVLDTTILPITGLIPAALSAMLISSIHTNKQHLALYLLQIISVYFLPYNSPSTVWAGTTMGLLHALYTSPEQPSLLNNNDNNNNNTEVIPSPHYLDTPPASSIHDYFSPISSLVSPEEEQDLLRYDVYTHHPTTEIPHNHNNNTVVRSTKKTLAICGMCIVWIVSLWVLTVFYPQQLPTQLQIQDATYGCHTVYQMTVNSNKNYCHQVCLPLWYTSTEGKHGQCSDYRFTCFDHTDAFPINSKIAIQRDWYTINKGNNNACQ